ncbi:MAG: hypothetical protein JXR19_03445 [Bacteroidia bacterium]
MASLKISPDTVVRGNPLTISLFNEFRNPLRLELCSKNGELLRLLESTDRKVIIYQLNTQDLIPGQYLVVIRTSSKAIQHRINVQHKKQKT